MFDFNDIGIKSTDDLQEALSIETCAKSFKDQFIGMVERWGLESATSMLAIALCGDGDEFKPLIKFTHKHIPTGPPDDPWSGYRLVKIKQAGKDCKDG